MVVSSSVSLAEARRIALAAQGFATPKPDRKVSLGDVRGVIHRLGVLQLDYVNVVGPAHFHILFSRLGSYDRGLLPKLVYQRREFTEHWAHEASIIPMESWPLLAYRRSEHRVRPYGFERFLRRHSGYADGVVEQVRQRGALTAAEVAEPGVATRALRHSWFGSVPRAVLEAHFGRGVLSISNRLPNFARTYDLTERIIPDAHRHNCDEHAGQRALLEIAARGCGVATAADLADYFRMPVTKAKPRIVELAESGVIFPVAVEGWREPAWMHCDAKLPDAVHASALLSPFDPLIWFRKRTERLFRFDYRFEIFVPAAKRRWGCYVFPFLYGDELVARIDLKADREAGVLSVRSEHFEPGKPLRKTRAALHRELIALADWMGLKNGVNKASHA